MENSLLPMPKTTTSPNLRLTRITADEPNPLPALHIRPHSTLQSHEHGSKPTCRVGTEKGGAGWKWPLMKPTPGGIAIQQQPGQSISAHLGALLVGLLEEQGKQGKEAEVDKKGEPRGVGVGGAAPREVVEVEVGKDHDTSRAELDDLHGGHPLLPPGADAQHGHHVVIVHQCVDERIHKCTPPRPLQPGESEPGPHDEEHDCMVVDVKRNGRLVAQGKNDSIHELPVFGQVE
mmetsp:Transcript_29035/g.52136  ORF Transcript_29035/g.52136 Transcript_29035/m.52136 type:complete len:233 (+) Transcript_29035:1483-2181(+)